MFWAKCLVHWFVCGYIQFLGVTFLIENQSIVPSFRRHQPNQSGCSRTTGSVSSTPRHTRSPSPPPLSVTPTAGSAAVLQLRQFAAAAAAARAAAAASHHDECSAGDVGGGAISSSGMEVDPRRDCSTPPTLPRSEAEMEEEQPT